MSPSQIWGSIRLEISRLVEPGKAYRIAPTVIALHPRDHLLLQVELAYWPYAATRTCEEWILAEWRRGRCLPTWSAVEALAARVASYGPPA